MWQKIAAVCGCSALHCAIKTYRCHSAALGTELSIRVSPLLKSVSSDKSYIDFFPMIWRTTSSVRICLPSRRGEGRVPSRLFGGIEYFHTHMLGAGNVFLLSKSRFFWFVEIQNSLFFFP